MNFAKVDLDATTPKKSKPSKSPPAQEPASTPPGREQPKEYPVDTPRPASPARTDYD